MIALRSIGGLTLLFGSAVLGASSPQPRSAPALVKTAQTPDRIFEVEEIDGEAWCTIHGNSLRITDVVNHIADRLGLSVVGIASIPEDAHCDVYLDERRVSEALAYILGLVELRAERKSGRLTILPIPDADGALATQLGEQASLVYLRVVRSFPEYEELPRVLLEQARVNHSLGREVAARSQYEDLVNRFPFAEETTAGLYELGQLLMEQGEFGNAAQEFAELLRFEHGTQTEIDARLQLAHCRAELGQYEDALLILKALDSATPPETREDRQERFYARARFLIGLSDARGARDALDKADSFGVSDGRIRRIALRLRAMVHELDDEPAQASRAWLTYQAEVEGGDRLDALVRAAQNAVEAGRGEDMLSVLFIARLAEENGGADLVREQVAEARRALGLQTAELVEAPRQVLATARKLISEEHYPEANDKLESLLVQRANLSKDELLDLIGLYAKTLTETRGIDSMAAFLRNELERWEDTSSRKFIYLTAADLFGANGSVQAEIDALQGRL